MDIKRCDLCPRECGVDRAKRKKGYCQAGNKLKISWYGLHFGEEPVISGAGGPASTSTSEARRGGSGTIFFCHCNLKCVFCQNWQISQPSSALRFGGLRKGKGVYECKDYEGDEVVRIILELQKKGAHNINLVTPTIWSYWLKEIIIEAKKNGLKIPVIWNSNGYESVRVLREMGEAGAVDIYLPDYKYASEKLARKYSSAPNYPEAAKKAILEMQRQVGDLILDKNGIAKKGLIIRHLILPNAMENTKGCLKFISSLSKKVHLSLMTQYNPLYRAKEFGEINRPINKEEFAAAEKLVSGFGIKNGWIQEFGGTVKCLNPDFRKDNPFG